MREDISRTFYVRLKIHLTLGVATLTLTHNFITPMTDCCTVGLPFHHAHIVLSLLRTLPRYRHLATREKRRSRACSTLTCAPPLSPSPSPFPSLPFPPLLSYSFSPRLTPGPGRRQPVALNRARQRRDSWIGGRRRK